MMFRNIELMRDLRGFCRNPQNNNFKDHYDVSFLFKHHYVKKKSHLDGKNTKIFKVIFMAANDLSTGLLNYFMCSHILLQTYLHISHNYLDVFGRTVLQIFWKVIIGLFTYWYTYAVYMGIANQNILLQYFILIFCATYINYFYRSTVQE